jgi:hypothetical protein
LGRRLGRPQSLSRHGGEKENSQPLPGLEPPTIQPVAHRYTAELSMLFNMKHFSNYILRKKKFLIRFYMRNEPWG